VRACETSPVHLDFVRPMGFWTLSTFMGDKCFN